jgi:hypothetical protein
MRKWNPVEAIVGILFFRFRKSIWGLTEEHVLPQGLLKDPACEPCSRFPLALILQDRAEKAEPRFAGVPVFELNLKDSLHLIAE